MERMPKTVVRAAVCGTCIHYRQHYVLGKYQKLTPLWYGHCTLPEHRHPNPDEACERWEEATD